MNRHLDGAQCNVVSLAVWYASRANLECLCVFITGPWSLSVSVISGCFDRLHVSDQSFFNTN